MRETTSPPNPFRPAIEAWLAALDQQTKALYSYFTHQTFRGNLLDGSLWVEEFACYVRQAVIEGTEPLGADGHPESYSNQAPTPLPLWQCHKQVRAAKILNMRSIGEETVAFDLDGGQSVTVTADWIVSRVRKATEAPTDPCGGYYVEYDTGYTSWSPAKAFEEGYFRGEGHPMALEDYEQSVLRDGREVPLRVAYLVGATWAFLQRSNGTFPPPMPAIGEVQYPSRLN